MRKRQRKLRKIFENEILESFSDFGESDFSGRKWR